LVSIGYLEDLFHFKGNPLLALSIVNPRLPQSTKSFTR